MPWPASTADGEAAQAAPATAISASRCEHAPVIAPIIRGGPRVCRS